MATTLPVFVLAEVDTEKVDILRVEGGGGSEREEWGEDEEEAAEEEVHF